MKVNGWRSASVGHSERETAKPAPVPGESQTDATLSLDSQSASDSAEQQKPLDAMALQVRLAKQTEEIESIERPRTELERRRHYSDSGHLLPGAVASLATLKQQQTETFRILKALAVTPRKGHGLCRSNKKHKTKADCALSNLFSWTLATLHQQMRDIANARPGQAVDRGRNAILFSNFVLSAIAPLAQGFLYDGQPAMDLFSEAAKKLRDVGQGQVRPHEAMDTISRVERKLDALAELLIGNPQLLRDAVARPDRLTESLFGLGNNSEPLTLLAEKFSPAAPELAMRSAKRLGEGKRP